MDAETLSQHSPSFCLQSVFHALREYPCRAAVEHSGGYNCLKQLDAALQVVEFVAQFSVVLVKGRPSRSDSISKFDFLAIFQRELSTKVPFWFPFIEY